MVRDRSFYKTIFAIALPSAFQAMVSFLVVLADNMMVARLGDTVYAGVAQANGVIAFFTATITGLVGGSAVLISQYWGKKDMERIKRIFAIVSWVCAGVAFLFAAAGAAAPRTILRLMTSDEDIVEAGIAYFRIMSLSFVPYAVSAALIGMLRSIEVVKVTVYITMTTLFVDIGLNYVFIFGKLGMPAMGAAGAAATTVFSRVLELAIVTYYLFRVQKKMEIQPRDLLRGDRLLLKDYLRYGVPVCVVDAQWAIIGVLKTSIIGRLGGQTITANGIGASLMQLGTLFSFSLAGGACVVIGKTVGEKDYERTRAYAKSIQIMFAGIGIVMAALVYIVRAPFASLYGVSDTTRNLAAEMVGIAAISLVGTTYHASCFVGINRGAGDNRFVMIVDMLCGWLVVLPVSYLAAFVLHVPNAWMLLVLRIDQLFKWIIAFCRLRGNAWIRNVTREDAPTG